MSDPKPQSPRPLMELDISSPKGYPKLPKWNSTLKYRLKDKSLINASENPFHVSSDLDDNSEEIDFAKRKRLARLLPKCAPSPHITEEPEKKSKPQSKTETESSRRQIADQEFPIRYTTMNESSETINSTNSNASTTSGSSLSYIDKYLEMKRTKALLLKKIKENNDYSLESCFKYVDPVILTETDFFLEEDVIKRETEFSNGFPQENYHSIKETSFIFSENSESSPEGSNSANNNRNENYDLSSSTGINITSKNSDLSILMDQMNECYI